jgi:hypothetical protein
MKQEMSTEGGRSCKIEEWRAEVLKTGAVIARHYEVGNC